MLRRFLIRPSICPCRPIGRKSRVPSSLKRAPATAKARASLARKRADARGARYASAGKPLSAHACTRELRSGPAWVRPDQGVSRDPRNAAAPQSPQGSKRRMRACRCFFGRLPRRFIRTHYREGRRETPSGMEREERERPLSCRYPHKALRHLLPFVAQL
jgi:hypothetical protein